MFGFTHGWKQAEKIWPYKEKPSVKTEGFSHYGLVKNRLREVSNHSHSIIYNNHNHLILKLVVGIGKIRYRLLYRHQKKQLNFCTLR